MSYQNVIRWKVCRNLWQGINTVQIVDQNIVPVAGATVSASYWGPNQAVVSAGTNGNGKAILKTSYSFRPRGEW